VAGQVHARGFSWVRWGNILEALASEEEAKRGAAPGTMCVDKLAPRGAWPSLGATGYHLVDLACPCPHSILDAQELRHELAVQDALDLEARDAFDSAVQRTGKQEA
jgi:hypothetical protein